MKKNKFSIVFTGGGSGGHAVVAMTLIDYFKSRGIEEISFIGSEDGLEKTLASSQGIQYYGVSTGKLRRYFSFQNALDVFKVLYGIFQSLLLFLGKLKTVDVVFSTGGFVAVPAVIAGKLLGKRIVLHEQTSRVGLANKITSYFADKIFVTFEDSLNFFPKNKTILTGYPLRDEITSKEISHENLGPISLKEKNKPLLYITGGGNGAKLINDLVLENLDRLLANYNIIHQVGKKFYGEFQTLVREGYYPVPFIDGELPSVLKAADVVISRAGAGTVCELVALGKKVIFIPLKIAQRNEQYFNALEASKYIEAKVVSEDEWKQGNIADLLQGSFPTGEKKVFLSNQEIKESIFNHLAC